MYGQDKKANNNNVKTNQTNVASKQKTSLPPAKHLNSCTKSTKRQISTFVNYIYQNILYSAIASISPCLVISMCVQMYSGLLRDKDITLVKFNSIKILFYPYKLPQNAILSPMTYIELKVYQYNNVLQAIQTAIGKRF